MDGVLGADAVTMIIGGRRPIEDEELFLSFSLERKDCVFVYYVDDSGGEVEAFYSFDLLIDNWIDGYAHPDTGMLESEDTEVVLGLLQGAIDKIQGLTSNR